MFIIKAKYEESVMSEIHMVCGYMGFGKTMLAKRLAKRLPAVRLTHDEICSAVICLMPNFESICGRWRI